MALVAAGFAIEALWSIASTAGGPPHAFLRRLQLWVGLLDPPVLLAFALTYGERSRPKRLTVVWVAYIVAAIGLAIAKFPLEGADWVSPSAISSFWPEFAYVNGTYLVATGILLARYQRESRRYMARHLLFLTVGIGFAGLSRTQAAFRIGSPLGDTIGLGNHYAAIALGLGAALLLMLLLALAVRLNRNIRRQRIMPVAAALALLLVAFHALQGVLVFVYEANSGISLEAFWFGYRWLVFGAIVGYGILRYQLFDFELRARQAIALTGSSCIGVVVGIVAVLWAQDRGIELWEARWLGLLVGFLAGVASYLAVRQMARLLAPDLEAGEPQRARRREIYEAALEFALRKSQWSEADRRHVETLREVFEIGQEEHDEIVQRVRFGTGSPTGEPSSAG